MFLCECVCALTVWFESLSWPSVGVAGCGTGPWWAAAAGPGGHLLHSLPEQSRISVTATETGSSVWSQQNYMHTHSNAHIPSNILLSWCVALWCSAAVVRGVTAMMYWWPGGCSYRNLPGKDAGILVDANCVCVCVCLDWCNNYTLTFTGQQRQSYSFPYIHKINRARNSWPTLVQSDKLPTLSESSGPMLTRGGSSLEWGGGSRQSGWCWAQTWASVGVDSLYECEREMEGGTAELLFRAATWDHCTFPEMACHKAIKQDEKKEDTEQGKMKNEENRMSYDVWMTKQRQQNNNQAKTKTK